MFPRRSLSGVFNEIWHTITLLSNILSHLVPRSLTDSDLKRLFTLATPCSDVLRLFGDAVGNLDTFPVYVNRPKDSLMRKALYQGKYKAFVVKVQLLVSHTGLPLFWSGPHLGVTSDIRIWREHASEAFHLPENFRVLADKAYVGDRHCLAPFKKRQNSDLDDFERNYNLVHSWYRATVEHTIGQIKKFRLVSSTFRGRLNTQVGIDRLRAAISLAVSLTFLQIQSVPLKDLGRTVLPEVEEAKDSLMRARVQPRPRQYLNDLPLGDLNLDLRVIERKDGSKELCGPGEEPSDARVNTRKTTADFRPRDRVLAWWWGLWWKATVLRVGRKKLTIRFDHERAPTTGYLPRLVLPLIQ